MKRDKILQGIATLVGQQQLSNLIQRGVESALLDDGLAEDELVTGIAAASRLAIAGAHAEGAGQGHPPQAKKP